MGSKGSQTTTTNQNQTYTPAGASYIQQALGMAQNAASQPFNMPMQQVAGLTGQQNQAFDAFGQAYNSAQPYYGQAGNLYQQSANTDVNSYLNPYIDAVTAQMNNVFGQQQSQTTGKLTQAAGGIGADRIAVGQANLANQQSLAAGQTLSGIYQNALAAAQNQQGILQNAAAGTAALGSNAQNSALQGAQALYQSGTAQQQQQQNVNNALYNYQYQQAQYPYQQANFYSNIVGSLAPGLGGTTTGQGTTTTPSPSLFSQILGLGTAGVGALGGSGAFSGSGGKGSTQTGSTYGGYGTGSNGWGSMGGVQYPAYARGGATSPYEVDFTKRPDGSWGYAEGGEVSDEPININTSSFVPSGQVAKIQPHMPQLNLNPPQQSGGSGSGSGGGGGGDIIGMAMKFLPMVLNRGGAVDTKKFDGFNPYSMHEHRFPQGYAAGGAPDDDVINPDEPYRLAGPEAMEEWRKGVATDAAAGLTHPQTGTGDDLPPVITQGPAGAPAAAPAPPQRAMAFAPQGQGAAPAQAASPYAPTATAPAAEAPAREKSFMDSPWAALVAAGLGIASGTSPFALTNIGQGGLQGLKTLEQQRAAAQKQQTIDQSARRLEQEAKFHEDQYSRMTPAQREQLDLARRRQELAELQPVKVGTDMFGRDIFAKKDPKTGKYINIMTGKPVDDPTDARPPDYRIPGAGPGDESALPPNARPTSDTPTGVDLAFLSTLPPAMQVQVKAVSEGRRPLNPRSKEDQALVRLVGQYDPSFDLVNYNARAKARQDFTAGKSAQNITSFNTAIGHLGSLDKAIDNLKNSDFPSYNKVANWLAEETGDTRFQKARAEFQNAKTAVTEELTRAFRGTGGNVHDIIEWDKSLNEASSPAALHQAVKTAVELLRSRIEAVGDQYNRGLGTTKDSMHLLSPKAQEAIKRLEGEASPEKAAAANPALDQARAAIAKGAPREAVIKRLRENGVDPTGL